MSTRSDWDVLESYEQVETSPQGTTDVSWESLEEFSEPKKPQGTFETIKGVGQQYARGAASEFAALPRNVADLVKTGSKLLAERGLEQQLKQGKTPSPKSINQTQKILSTLGMPSDLLETIGWPTTEKANEYIRNLAESLGSEQAPSEPLSKAERYAKTIGEFTGGSLVGGPRKAVQRALSGTIAGTGAVLGEEAGLGGLGQLGSALGLSTLLNIAYQIKKGKYKPDNKQLEALKKYGEQFGLTKKELTPLLQSEKKISKLSKIAKPSEETKTLFQNIESKLGDTYETIKSEAKASPSATNKTRVKLVDEFEKINQDLGLSKLPPDDKLKVIEKISDAVESLEVSKITAPELIETYLDINKTVNWNSYKGGKRDLVKLKTHIGNALSEIDPKIGKDFEKVTELYSRFKNIEDKIGLNRYKELGSYAKNFAFLGSLSTAVGTLNFKAIPAIFGSYMTAEMSQKLATKMLTDPKYQNILIKTVQGFKSGSKSVLNKSFSELQKQIKKDYPKEYNKIDWAALEEK